jgi:hypothetical protein
VSKQQKVVIIVVTLACLTIGFVSGLCVGRSRGFPFVAEETEWSIGIYMGEDSFTFLPSQEVKNPVLTAKDVTDVPAKFVADPFMVKESGTWYMFFEVMNALTGQGDIGLATSDNGLHWTYKQIVLDEPFHLSYPCVFKWNNEYYMIPEACQTYSIRLYKANKFPTEWVFFGKLITGDSFVDPSFFHHGGKCWIFTSLGNDILKLYYSDDLTGPWLEHADSPVMIGNGNVARPGGRVITFDGTIVRYAQDDEPDYGNQVRAFMIDELTTSSYKEHEVNMSPILKATGAGWNSEGMHHIDPHQTEGGRWIACVDGRRKILVFGPEY